MLEDLEAYTAVMNTESTLSSYHNDEFTDKNSIKSLLSDKANCVNSINMNNDTQVSDN